jgi:hypothetical protein
MTKITPQSILSFFISLLLPLLSGCDSIAPWRQSNEVVLPEAAPLATQELVKVATTCRKKVEDLEHQSAYVPGARKGEYSTVLKMAANNCSELEETLKRLKQAAYQKEGFLQNIQHGQSTLVRESKKAFGPSKGTFVDFSEFEPDDSEDINFEPLK